MKHVYLYKYFHLIYLAQSPKLIVFKLCLHCSPLINSGKFWKGIMFFMNLHLVRLSFLLSHTQQSASSISRF